jgi:hypothetical protein
MKDTTNGGNVTLRKYVKINYNLTANPIPDYLPFPVNIGSASTTTGTSTFAAPYTCYEGDTVYVKLHTAVTKPPYDDTAYTLIFIKSDGTVAATQPATYNSAGSYYSFTAPVASSGGLAVGTAYYIALKHTGTSCIYQGTLGFSILGPKPSTGLVFDPAPVPQDPCFTSLLISGKDTTAGLGAITRLQIYSANTGSAPDYTGDINKWNNIAVTKSSDNKTLTFTLDNSEKTFPADQTDLQSKTYKVAVYSKTSSNPDVWAQINSNIDLVLSTTDPKFTITQDMAAPNPPINTLYEHTLTLSCSNCKGSTCTDYALHNLDTIVWTSSLGKPAWLDLIPGGSGSRNTVVLSGTPVTLTAVDFTVTATVPYYKTGSTFINRTVDYRVTFTPTDLFVIGELTLPPTYHYVSSYTQDIPVSNVPNDATGVTWSIVDRQAGGVATRALPVSTGPSPMTFVDAISGGKHVGRFTWSNVDDPGALYPATYVFTVKATATGGSLSGTYATGKVTLVVSPVPISISGVDPTDGYFDFTNAPVVIIGENLRPSSVTFGDSDATITDIGVDNRSITCIPPTVADIGGNDLQVVITVNNDDGGSATYSYYRYTRKRNPIVTSVIPAGGTFRGGTKVALIGSNFEPTSTVIIDDVLQPILAITPTSIIFVTMPHSVGAADVVVTNSFPPSSTTVYTYGTEPKILDVQPYNVSADGNTVVYISGTDFQTGVRVFVDDFEIPADRITVV